MKKLIKRVLSFEAPAFTDDSNSFSANKPSYKIDFIILSPIQFPQFSQKTPLWYHKLQTHH